MRAGRAGESAIATPPLLARLLQQTSRTFALTIPFLDEPVRGEVTVAYLLFRVADTIEDATGLTREQKLEQLAAFERLMARPDGAAARSLVTRWRTQPPTPHAGYTEQIGRASCRERV